MKVSSNEFWSISSVTGVRGSSFPPTNPVCCTANIDVVDVTAAAIVFETAGFAAISVLTTLMTFAAFSLIVPLSLYASAIFSDNSLIWSNIVWVFAILKAQMKMNYRIEIKNYFLNYY